MTKKTNALKNNPAMHQMQGFSAGFTAYNLSVLYNALSHMKQNNALSKHAIIKAKVTSRKRRCLLNKQLPEQVYPTQ